MYTDGNVYMGLDSKGKRVVLDLAYANRHGLIAGATGTGKTITMKVMAESFSAAGVPVFLCDIKGDVCGIAEPGEDGKGMQKRIDKFGIRNEFTYRSYPTIFWDIYGERGHQIRTTVKKMGPALMARILELSEVQEGVLNIVFRVADKAEKENDSDIEGRELANLEDLRKMLNYAYLNRENLSIEYGNMAATSITSIIRALIPLEDQGADKFFGEPVFDIHEWFRKDDNGYGYVNLLDSVKLVQNPKLYSTFLLWLMTELFAVLPEKGNVEKPELVFFFDEAHLLFKDAEKSLITKIEQTVKLIRSKGVGIYFVTQSPSDVPDTVLAQLSNRVQHALRAYTPAEQKAVKTAAQTFRPNPSFSTESVIMTLGTGEALTSFLDDAGVPGIVQKTAIICPESLMSPCSDETRDYIMNNDPISLEIKRIEDEHRKAEEEEAAKRLNDENAALMEQINQIRMEREKLKGGTSTAPASSSAYAPVSGAGNDSEAERLRLETEKLRLENEKAAMEIERMKLELEMAKLKAGK